MNSRSNDAAGQSKEKTVDMPMTTMPGTNMFSELLRQGEVMPLAIFGVV